MLGGEAAKLHRRCQLHLSLPAAPPPQPPPAIAAHLHNAISALEAEAISRGETVCWKSWLLHIS